MVNSWQRSELTPQLEYIIRIIAQVLGAQDPEMFTITWPNLEQLSSKEIAELEKMHAETDQIRSGLGFPEDTMLLHRYGKDEYDPDPAMLTEDDKESLDSIIRMKKQFELGMPADESL